MSNNTAIITESQMLEAANKPKDTYVILDISEIYMRTKPTLETYFSEHQIYEIYRQLFYHLRPDLSYYMPEVMRLPNYGLLDTGNIEFTPAVQHAVRETIGQIGFQIYMSAKSAGLFMGDYGAEAFPFFLEHLSQSAAYLLLDKTLVARQRAKQLQD